MTTEDYVSYPIALALKKAGFDELCRYYYNPKGMLRKAKDNALSPEALNNRYLDEIADGCCTAAPLWQAQKWLREKKSIAINVIAHDTSDRYCEGKYHWEEVYLPNFSEEGHQWVDWFIYGKHPLFDTYEEALSDGLSQMLKLIEKKGE